MKCGAQMEVDPAIPAATAAAAAAVPADAAAAAAGAGAEAAPVEEKKEPLHLEIFKTIKIAQTQNGYASERGACASFLRCFFSRVVSV